MKKFTVSPCEEQGLQYFFKMICLNNGNSVSLSIYPQLNLLLCDWNIEG